jgi:hypothetical protein
MFHLVIVSLSKYTSKFNRMRNSRGTGHSRGKIEKAMKASHIHSPRSLVFASKMEQP